MLRKENYNGIVILGLALTLLIFVGFAAYLLLENARVAEAASILEEERLSHGQEIWNEQCSTCHGANGEGGVGTALNNKKLLQNTHDDRFFSIIRAGIPSTQMPAWSVDFGGPLTDEDIRSAVTYIRSWESTAPIIEPVVFEPTAEEGAVIFETTCATCHGSNGIGSEFAPAVNDSEFLAMNDNEILAQVLLYGKPAQGMPSFGAVLSEEQNQHLLALFDTWRAGKTVTPAFDVTSLINAAIFSLEMNDLESATLQVNRAISVIPTGSGKDMLSAAKTKLTEDDSAGALETLTTLQVQWPIGDAANGEVLYMTSCLPCHGEQGEGGVGAVLHPNEFIQSNTTSDLVAFIQEGRPGTAMTGFDTRLSEQEIADIVAFLRTWQP